MSLERARERINQLEDAIRRLDSVRKHLMKNASEICKEVQGSINFSIECLRSREHNLLEEVHQVRVMKEESLQLQQARLRQAVNILCTAVTLVTENPASEKHLVDTLDRLTQLELSPEETPYISFRVDHLQTREHLLSYGRVDANGLPLANAFEDPDTPSASLPRHVEEYDDGDHHVFYKTLQEIQKPDTVPSIRVNIPKLSQRPEDWLQKKSEPVQSYGNKLNPVSSQCDDSGNSCSLNNWLSLIKNHADLEEEHNFEIVDNTSFKFKSDKDNVSSSDLQKWLNPASSSSSQDSSDLFDHITKDSGAWLMNVCSQLASVESTAQMGEKIDMFQHISKEPSSWLRSRATRHSTQPEVKDFFSHISKDSNQWLCSGGSSSKRKLSFQGSYAKRKLEDNAWNNKEVGKVSSPSQNKWLFCKRVPVQIPEMTQPVRSASFQSINPWLMSTSSTMTNPSSDSSQNNSVLRPLSQSCMDISEKNGANNDVGWLIKNISDISINASDANNYTNDIEKSGLWLSKDCNPEHGRNIQPTKSSSIDDLYDWLLIPQNSQTVESHTPVGSVAQIEGDKDSNDSWSVCSVPHSKLSDQYAKDVAAAEEYYNKWLV